MAVRSLMYSQDTELVDRFSTALRVLGIQTERSDELSHARERLSETFDAVLVDCDHADSADVLKAVRDSQCNSRAIVLAIADLEKHAALGELANFQISKPVNWDLAKRTLRAARTLIHRERRRAERTKLRCNASLEMNGREFGVRLMDLSTHGALIEFEGRLETRRRVVVSFILPGTHLKLSSKARVIWQEEGRSGLEFFSVPNDVTSALQSWLSAHSADSRTILAEAARSRVF